MKLKFIVRNNSTNKFDRKTVKLYNFDMEVYKDFQKKQGKFEKEMANTIGVPSLKELKLNSKQHLALKLWDAQDGYCLYSGKRIDPHDIVRDFSLFEIDHIIPISISFDDSQENKVLCYREENQ
mgnify:CR=1 FL=1